MVLYLINEVTSLSGVPLFIHFQIKNLYDPVEVESAERAGVLGAAVAQCAAVQIQSSSSSFHRLDMTLAVAEALNPNKLN